MAKPSFDWTDPLLLEDELEAAQEKLAKLEARLRKHREKVS